MSNIYISENAFKLTNYKSIVTIGTFDGIHQAHKKIITQLVETAKANNAKSIVFSFKNNPRDFFTKKQSKKISTIPQKIEILENLNVDILILKEFDADFANLTAEKFIKEILIDQLNMETIIIGDDHRLGKDREGSFENLMVLAEKYNFKIIQIESVFVEHIRVSSTNIRREIAEGKIDCVNKLLGYNYFFDGKVISGNKIGRDIGFPTANIEINSEKYLPATGVYAVSGVIDNETINGMANIGYRPTINQSKNITFEVHFFNFDKDIYNKNVKIIFYKKIRNEMKFNSKDELIRQLFIDKKTVTNFFNENSFFKNTINFS